MMVDKSLFEIKKMMKIKGYEIEFDCVDEDFAKYKINVKKDDLTVCFYYYLGHLLDGDIEVCCETLIKEFNEGYNQYLKIK